MMRTIIKVAVFVLVLSFGLRSTCRAATPPNIFLIVIDGVRDLEIQGKAKNDFGKNVAASEIFPQMTLLKKKALFLPKMTTSNRFGVSLPGYADIFTGKRQEGIQSNSPAPSDLKNMTPTVFEESIKQLHWASTDVMVLGSWEKICKVASPTTENGGGFFQSCGWEKGKFIKPSVHEDSRTDADTFLEASQLIKEKHPKLTFIHFGDADEEAHLNKTVKKKKSLLYGIHHYHQALRDSDYYIGRLWEQITSDPFYQKDTYLFITTDHGRDDDSESWSDHGNCLFCSGHSRVFGMVLGPDINPKSVNTAYQHTDIAPTIAQLLGVQMSSATGKPIAEVFAKRALASKEKH